MVVFIHQVGSQLHSISLSLVVFSSVYRWWRITYLVKVTRSNLVYSSFFPPDFVSSTSISFHYSMNMKISMINTNHMKFRLETFHGDRSCMTSRRRHFVFFTMSHIIDHIFLTKWYFAISFMKHKLQVNIYRYVHSWPRARHDARTRARQNLKMLKIQVWSIFYTFQTILSILKIYARARLSARFGARSTYGSKKCRFFAWFWFLILPITFSIDF